MHGYHVCQQKQHAKTAMDQTIEFRNLVPMNTRQHKEYYRALNQILCYYNDAGFVITEIDCNGEYHGLDVKMNFTNAQDYVPKAEWNNRMIKEQVPAAYQHLP